MSDPNTWIDPIGLQQEKDDNGLFWLGSASISEGKVVNQVSALNVHKNLDNIAGVVIMINSIAIGATTKNIVNSVAGDKINR